MATILNMQSLKLEEEAKIVVKYDSNLTYGLYTFEYVPIPSLCIHHIFSISDRIW